MIIKLPTPTGEKYEVVQSIEKIKERFADSSPFDECDLITGITFAVKINDHQRWSFNAYDSEKDFKEKEARGNAIQSCLIANLVRAMKTNDIYDWADLYMQAKIQADFI